MTVSERRVRVYDDKASLASAVAARFIKRMRETLAEKPEAHVVLTGGSMGEAVLAAVGGDKGRDKVDWSRVTFWWGDERYLPSGDVCNGPYAPPLRSFRSRLLCRRRESLSKGTFSCS